jgi:hydrogenase maturation factor
MNALEQDVLNVVALAEKAAAALVSANNPKYAGVIATISSLSSSAASAVGVPAVTSTLPEDLAANVAPTINAVNTLVSKTATSTQKAAALTSALTSVTVIGEDIWSFVAQMFSHPTAVAPAPATPPAAGS